MKNYWLDLKKSKETPHIYGFNSPTKHCIKMLDGDRKWKRIEIFSNQGSIIMKDDYLHNKGQWKIPK